MSFSRVMGEQPWTAERLPTERFSVLMNDRSDPRWGFDIKFEAFLAARALHAVYPHSKIEIFDRLTSQVSNLHQLAATPYWADWSARTPLSSLVS